MLIDHTYETSVIESQCTMHGVDNHKKPTLHQNYENNDYKQGMGLL
jgi:hypothetical protein